MQNRVGHGPSPGLTVTRAVLAPPTLDRPPAAKIPGNIRPTTRRVPSGLVISPDSRYAFVTQEGVGSEPGAVDVIDLRALTRVASVDLGQQAGGIDFWKSEP